MILLCEHMHILQKILPNFSLNLSRDTQEPPWNIMLKSYGSLLWYFYAIFGAWITRLPFTLFAWRRAVWTFLKTSPFVFCKRKSVIGVSLLGELTLMPGHQQRCDWHHRPAADLSLSGHVSLLGLSTVSIPCLLLYWTNNCVLPSHIPLFHQMVLVLEPVLSWVIRGAASDPTHISTDLRAKRWSNWLHYYITCSCALQS